MPKLLWISVAALGVMMVCNIAGGIVQGNGFIIAVGLIDAVLIWGVFSGFRWAFWTAAALVFGGLIYIMLVGGIGSIAASVSLDTLMFVPMVVCRDYFFLGKDLDVWLKNLFR